MAQAVTAEQIRFLSNSPKRMAAAWCTPRLAASARSRPAARDSTMGAAFTNPFLIGGVTAGNPVVTEEILGPVATFQVCDTEDEGLALAHYEITARGAADRLCAIGTKQARIVTEPPKTVGAGVGARRQELTHQVPAGQDLDPVQARVLAVPRGARDAIARPALWRSISRGKMRVRVGPGNAGRGSARRRHRHPHHRRGRLALPSMTSCAGGPSGPPCVSEAGRRAWRPLAQAHGLPPGRGGRLA